MFRPPIRPPIKNHNHDLIGFRAARVRTAGLPDADADADAAIYAGRRPPTDDRRPRRLMLVFVVLARTRPTRTPRAPRTNLGVLARRTPCTQSDRATDRTARPIAPPSPPRRSKPFTGGFIRRSASRRPSRARQRAWFALRTATSRSSVAWRSAVHRRHSRRWSRRGAAAPPSSRRRRTVAGYAFGKVGRTRMRFIAEAP